MNKMLCALVLCLFTGAAFAECGRPDDVGFDPTGEKKRAIYAAQDKAYNPAAALLGCFTQFAEMGLSVSTLKSNCGCKEAIKQICSFKRKKGKWRISAGGGANKAWCVPFVPY